MSFNKTKLGFFATILLLALPCAGQKPQAAEAAQNSGTTGTSQILSTTETFIRNLFAWGPQFQVKLGPLTPSSAADFYVVPVNVTVNDRTDTGEVYVSKDGKTLFRGEMFDMSTDPYAADRAKLHVEGNPSKGPANARVTIVEFSDFECPHCRELEESLKTITEHYQARLVYKDFPLTQIHPWASTASIGGRCAFLQSPDAFWKIHDEIFQNQDVITPENVWDKLAGFASEAGLDAGSFKTCMSSPEAAKAVDANQSDGVSLNVNSTPTIFVNGRPVVGGDSTALEQLIEFELAAHPK